MRISMQILADRLRQNYPDCSFGELSGEMNLKRPLFYQSGTEFRKNKVYIVHETDISETDLLEHGDNLVLVVGERFVSLSKRLFGVCFFPSENSAEMLFNIVQRVFDTYDAWDERMQRMALSERTMRTLLDSSYRIFQNPILVCTSAGFIIDYSTMMDTMPEFQNILQHNQILAAVKPEISSPSGEVQKYEDPQTQKNNLFVEIYDKNHNAYRVILAESSRKFRHYDEYLLVHLSKYIQQMLEKYTVLQSDLSYTLDRLLSNILTGEIKNDNSLTPRFAKFRWEETHQYFCMNIHVSMVDRQNLTVVRFICNRLEGLMKGSCAFLLDENIVVYVNLNHYGRSMEEALAAANDFLQDSYLKAGISYMFMGLNRLKSYYLQSKIALEEGLRLHPLRWVNRFEEIALDYLLGKCTERLESDIVCSHAVLTLKKYDAEHKTEYYQTLKTYLSCQMNAVKAAKELFIHRSTFLYRMAHIKELVQIDLEEPDQLLYLLLTYRLLEMNEQDK